MGTRPWVAALFLLPALVLLGALVAYPIGYTVYRSLFDADGTTFVGPEELRHRLHRPRHPHRGAQQRDLGDRGADRGDRARPGLRGAHRAVSWGTAFKLVVFMPMAISMLAAGIIFRLVYEQDPSRGVANAVVVAVHDTFTNDLGLPGGPAAPGQRPQADAPAGRTPRRRRPRVGTSADLPLVGIPQNKLPSGAQQAKPAARRSRAR